jgi:hypothetical protein
MAGSGGETRGAADSQGQTGVGTVERIGSVVFARVILAEQLGVPTKEMVALLDYFVSENE